MPAPLPHALRAWFKACIEEGLSGRAVAARLKLVLSKHRTSGILEATAHPAIYGGQWRRLDRS